MSSELGDKKQASSEPLVAKRPSETVRFAVGLIAFAIVSFLGLGFYLAGPDGVIPVLILFLIRALVTTMFAVAACFLVGAIFHVSFGLLRDAIIKLSAIAMSALAISTVVRSASTRQTEQRPSSSGTAKASPADGSGTLFLRGMLLCL